MKIGLLTFHSQQNYGGVLQCWALQTALEYMGHQVWIVDRWSDKKNGQLLGVRASSSVKDWFSLFARLITCQGGFSSIMRSIRFEKFIKTRLKATEYHFCEWNESPRNLGVDMLVVGSDQVWHGGDWGRPDIYLLEGAPSMPSIAYAASLGMTSIPDSLLDLYLRGLNRFHRISVREHEAQRILESHGFNATVVADPTLLVNPECWSRLVKDNSKKKSRNLVVYFIGEVIVNAMVSELNTFAVKHGYNVEIFTDGYMEPFCRNPCEILCRIWKFASSGIKVCAGAGPIHFLQSIATADYVITNSYHAVMFSSIYSRQVQIVAPQSASRKMMFSRIKEFVEDFIEGPAIVSNLSNAIQFIESGARISFRRDKISHLREKSIAWLTKTLKD